MPNQNSSDHSSKMMWLMILCCALPVIIFSLFGGQAIGALVWPGLGGSAWLIFGVLAVFLAVHLWLMKKSANHPAPPGNGKKSDDSRSHHDCCR